MQRHLIPPKATFLFSIVLLSAAVASPADANWFRNSQTNVNRNVGSAPMPTRQEIIRMRQGPDYPLQSQMNNEQGKVGLKIMLSDQGTMRDIVVERSSGFPRLDEAAVRYMKTYWHYQPAGKDKPMPATMQADVTFKLQ